MHGVLYNKTDDEVLGSYVKGKKYLFRSFDFTQFA